MKNVLHKIGAGISVLPVLLLPATAFAQLDVASDNLSDVGTTLGSGTDIALPDMIGNLINVLLSVLGIIFLILVLYAGFLYLTAAGDDGKVKKAKALITQGIIGLIIIVAAYAIAKFVIDSITASVSA